MVLLVNGSYLGSLMFSGEMLPSIEVVMEVAAEPS